ncbi:MAG: channel protein TolC, partial [Betaproteobacteria bacterium]|nr:channel protein TolC [Betaproteobacteria bacterium]
MRRAIAAAFTSLMLAAPAGAADLVEIYRLALGSDPVYASARAALEAAQEKRP